MLIFRRASLFSGSAFKMSHTLVKETRDNYDMHLVYKFSERMSLTNEELNLVFTAFLSAVWLACVVPFIHPFSETASKDVRSFPTVPSQTARLLASHW
jgi:hypothetical protein